MNQDLHNIIKALLFSTSEGVTLDDIYELLIKFEEDPFLFEGIEDRKYTKKELREELDELLASMEGSDDVYSIIKEAETYKIAITPKYSPWIHLYKKDTRPIKLSNAVLETLSLVAYRQPITRAQMEAIRGVSVDSSLNKLLEYELIYVQGQADLPGKPRLFATTEKFLEFSGINSLDDLPKTDVLSSHQITNYLESLEEDKLVSNAEVGLAES